MATSLPTHHPRTNAPRAHYLQPDPRRYGVRGVVPAGTHKGITAWHSRPVWLSAVRQALDDGAVPLAYTEGGKRDSMAPDTFMRLLAVHVRAADNRTGRGIDLTMAQVMAATGDTKGTVKRFRRIARRAAGLLAMLTHARPLKMEEPMGRVWVRHNTRTPDGAKGRQRGIPSIWAAVTPAWLRPYITRAARELTAARHAQARAHQHARRCPTCRRPVDNHSTANPQVAAESVDCVTQPRRAAHGGATSHLSDTSPCTHTGASLRSAQRTRSARRHEQAGSARSGKLTSTRPGTKRRRLPGQQLAADIAALVPWGSRLQPRRIASHLADYERAGWTAEQWLAQANIVLASHGRAGWSAPLDVRSPGGWVYWLTQRMTPYALDDQHDGIDSRDGAADVDEPQPCGHPDCDHGWITIDSHGIGAVIPCPHCPTGLRDHYDDVAGYPDDEPPF